MILILANEQDVHARHVLGALTKMGAEGRIVDTGQFGNGLNFSYALSAPATAQTSGRSDVDFGRAQSIWYRRPHLDRIAESVTDPSVRHFCRQEWANALDGFFLNTQARMVNPLVSEFAAVKPRQLQMAASVGFEIPDTLITSDPQAALEFINKHNGQVVHKALTAPKDRLLDTRVWSSGDQSVLKQLPLAPTIFQALIRGQADIRATVVGDQIFAAKIFTEAGRAGVDSRLDLDARHEAIALSQSVTQRLLAFMKSMGLIYGTIDLKVTDSGEVVFFEVNPQGQFLYIEILTGLPITQAMASLLAQA